MMDKKELIGIISVLVTGLVFGIGTIIIVMQGVVTNNNNYVTCNESNFTTINETINCSEYKDWKGINAEQIIEAEK